MKQVLALAVLVAALSANAAFAADTKVEEKATTEKTAAGTKHTKKEKVTKTDAAGDKKETKTETKTETK